MEVLETLMYMNYESGTMQVGEIDTEATELDIISLADTINTLQDEPYNNIEKRKYSLITL